MNAAPKRSLLEHSQRPLVGILILALALRVAVLFLHPYRIIHVDEVFQVLEPAHHRVFGYGIVSWEWRDGVRSWMLPLLITPLLWLFSALHLSSIGYTTAIRLVFGVLSLTSVWAAYEWAKRIAGASAAILAGLMVAVWPDIVISSVHTLNETFATCLILPALVKMQEPDEELGHVATFMSGLVFAFGVMARIQLLPVLIFEAIYVLLYRRSLAARFLIGAATAMCLFGALDWITWGMPFSSAVMYVKANIFQGRSLLFGVSPWYWYFKQLLKVFGPLLLFVIPAVRRDKHLATIAGLIVLVHSLVAHKEFRFMIPALPLIAIMISVGIWNTVEQISDVANGFFKRPANRLAITLAGIFVVAGFRALRASAGDNLGATEIFYALSGQQDVCGVEILGFPWTYSSGYTALHKAVPIFEDPTSALHLPNSYYNYVVGKPEQALPGYSRDRCADGACMYKRPGGCIAPPAEVTINEYIRSKDE